MRFGISLALAGLVSVGAVAPLVGAHHGEEGYGTATLSNGESYSVVMRYLRESMGQQVWQFTFVRDDGTRLLDCPGYGSVENGFKSGNLCPTKWSTAGTGEAHAYPNLNVDHHVVAVTFGPHAGSFDQTIFPDTGL